MAAPPGGRVIFIGLTGGLGAGKSTALDQLAELGAATLSTDAVVHELLETQELVDAIGARLGPEMTASGSIDRAALARAVFSDTADREWLEAQLWPRVRARIEQWREEVEATLPPPSWAVVEVPLLFESGLEGGFDATIAVVAGERLRRERAAGRGHELADERAALQLSQAEKSQRAGFVVRNDGTPAELRAELSNVLATMQAGDP